ncbi:MAG: TetR/AcrR family transcriptional regulator [Eubacteriales bacterium]
MTDFEQYNIEKMVDGYAAEAADKEIKIMNAAIKNFSQNGFSRTKTKDIAKDAGVGEGTIFTYFPSKESILESMIPMLIKIMQPKLEKPVQQILEDKKDASIDIIMGEIIFDRIKVIGANIPFMKALLPELIHRPNLLSQLKTAVMPIIHKYLGRLLTAAQEKGEIKKLDEDIAIFQITGFILGYIFLDTSSPQEDTKGKNKYDRLKDEERIRRDIEIFLKNLLEGWRIA